jgi:LPXTG-motif cell wall-anchored protein
MRISLGQDIEQPSFCCPDDQYCYTNAQGQALCCALGSTCDNPCPIASFFCGPTSNATGTASTTTSASASCCIRPCPADSQYQCASSYGAGCCNLGFSCTTKACISTAVAPTTLVSIVPSGCTTGQFSCASSLGGGCCDYGATCTDSDTNLLCASGTTAPSAIRTGPDGSLVSGISEMSPDTGLSTGAKAGIGVGIALFVCLVIAGLLWFFMRRRKAARLAQANSQQSESVSGGRDQSMSQAGAARPHGMADYFGPTAVPGPYTENESPGSQPARGVPLAPHSPGDIVGAVEIGHSRENSNVTSPGEVIEPNGTPDYLKEVPENTEYRVELP